MSESIFETFTDERGNISVRISQEVQVLTREEANRIEAEYRRMRAENAKLRELVVILMACLSVDDCDKCPINGAEFKVSEVRCCHAAKQWMRELGVDE